MMFRLVSMKMMFSTSTKSWISIMISSKRNLLRSERENLSATEIRFLLMQALIKVNMLT